MFCRFFDVTEQISTEANVIHMPDRLAEDLVRYIRQNDGKLSRTRRQGEFSKLRDDEVVLIEGIVLEAFEE